MLNTLIPALAIAGLFSTISMQAHAQFVVHAASGIVQSVNPAEKFIGMTMADGSRAQFTTQLKKNVALDFDGNLKSHATPSSSFQTIGAHAVVYYIGSEDDRTAISLKDLGPGPFKYAKGTVTHYDKHSHVLTIRDAHDQTETFSVSGQAVVDTGMGVKAGDKFDPGKGDPIRVTAVTKNGADEAVFISRRSVG